MLRQLAEKREACMRQLLCETSVYEEEIVKLEEPIEDNPLLRALAPQKQALTQGETVRLVQHDQLETKREE